MGEHLRLPKSELRRGALAARRERSPELLGAASRAICARVLCLLAFRRAAHLVAYAARPDEIDPAPLVAAALTDGRAVYFPRVVGPELDFVASRPDDLRPGAHGILEPAPGAPVPASAAGLLVLVPGLAFDPEGGRLGRGGGHYDRGLARQRTGLRLGLSLDADVCAGLPRDAWDQPMDAVMTERRLLWSGARPAIHEENRS
jgi:5-formyltetrahydrofolate cyclo-ligase